MPVLARAELKLLGMLKEKYELELFADYCQFYLQDEEASGDLSNSWTKQASDELLALAPSTIGVGTASNTTVPVTIELHDSPPEEDLALWDWVNECSLDVPSGKIVIAGCTDDFFDALRIRVEPGTYRARIFYGGLNTVEYATEGDDHYKVALWRGAETVPRIVKRCKLNCR